MNIDKLAALEQMLDLAAKLEVLCKPLFAATPITHYGYHEYHRDGRLARVISDKKGMEKYVGTLFPDLINDEPIRLKNLRQLHREAGFSLLDLEPQRPSIALNMESLGFGHFCAFVDKPNDSVVRVHHFVGRLEDLSVNRFHLNNTNMLRYFSRYIAKELRPYIDKTRLFNIFPEQLESYKQWMDAVGKSSALSIPQFLIEYAPHASISGREKELIYWLFMGKTTEEIAIILGVKTGTVKKYFDRLKRKFGCGSKNQILAELLKNGVCFEDLGIGTRI